MNALLMSELNAEHLNPISSLILLEQTLFEQPSSLSKQLDKLIRQCQSSIDPEQDILQQVEALLDTLYVTCMWVDNKRALWSSNTLAPSTSVAHTTIAPQLKVILLEHIILACGFDVDVVYIPETLMLRIVCDDEYAVIFDPITGEALNWQELDSRMDQLEGDPQQHYLKPEHHKLLIKNYLTAVKNAFIFEQQYDKALKTVDILLALTPNDPLERRDRGFLLHQLDCFKVAYDDYKFFIEQCPKDPAAQLLKLQLEHITIRDNVLH